MSREDIELTSIGQFTNEYGELFVVLIERYNPESVYITGDETAWEPTKLDSNFIFSEQELKKLKLIIKNYKTKAASK